MESKAEEGQKKEGLRPVGLVIRLLASGAGLIVLQLLGQLLG